MMSGHEASIRQHYGSADLLERILAALETAGKDLDALNPDDLAPVDEFHTRGRHATRELAELAGFGANDRVLDVGSGLGGPARFLAATCGCNVTGVDLVAEFCAVAEELSRRAGLSDRTQFKQGNALALPFPDGAFDAVWTIQAQMNIPDKQRFYGEIARVLKPGGRFAFQDICAGNGEPLHYPVPWAGRPEHNFLVEPDALRTLLGEVGLQERVWRDVSAECVAWRKAQAAKAAQAAGGSNGPPPLSLRLVMGKEASTKMANSGRNLEEGRIRFIQGVLHKPA
jgi:SAM-dependent methyltransferase